VTSRKIAEGIGAISALSFTSDSRLLVGTSPDEKVRVWDVKTGALIRTFDEHWRSVYAVAVSRDGRVATGDGEPEEKPGRVCVWEAESGSVRLWLGTPLGEDPRRFTAHREAVRSIAFSDDGGRIASASWDESAKIWDAATGRELVCFREHGHSLDAIAFGRGDTVASAGGGMGGRLTRELGYEILIWNAATGQVEAELLGHEREITGIAFLPGGDRLVSVSRDGNARVWNVRAESSSCERVLTHSHALYALALDPGGEHVATASRSGHVEIWNVGSGKRFIALPDALKWIHAVAWSPDGRWLSAGGGLVWGDGEVFLWPSPVLS
jgi:WD40 repeat protein